jgi:LasA protease
LGRKQVDPLNLNRLAPRHQRTARQGVLPNHDFLRIPSPWFLRRDLPWAAGKKIRGGSIAVVRGAGLPSNQGIASPRLPLSAGGRFGLILLSFLLLGNSPKGPISQSGFSSGGNEGAGSMERYGPYGGPSFSPGPDRSTAYVPPAGDLEDFYAYQTQAGDTLHAVAVRFNASYSEIQPMEGAHLPERGLLPTGRTLRIPKKFTATTESARLFPDSEIVYSPTSAGFSVAAFILGKRGYLSAYTDEDGKSGSEILLQLARENSINPKMLLAMLDYTSGWVSGPSPASPTLDYPMRFIDPYSRGLYKQMMLAVNFLERGYYGWREANVLYLYFGNGEAVRLAPDLNAGTVAVMYYFSKISKDPAAWKAGMADFFGRYSELFGDPRENALEPLFTAELHQPFFVLPFAIGSSWCFSNGPHGAWDSKGPAAALDFAPPQYEHSAAVTRMLLASATGCIVRSGENAVVLDLDCDGSEQTGWNLFYYHVAEDGRVREGSIVRKGEKIGYASSAGGFSTGIHVHMARKYNGEWILAAGAEPFSLSGWTVSAGAGGEWDLVRNGRTVIASADCNFPNMVFR